MNTEPYTPQMIAEVLRSMAPERLAAIQPVNFQMWPTRQIVPGRVISELISNERARRARRA